MKLIHTADLHLGARSTAHLTPEKARLRRRELLEGFGRIAEIAVSEGAEAVLIAGDLFDTAHPSREAIDYVLGTVRRTPGVQFLCLPGNHDGGRFPEVQLPENLTVFGAEWGCVSLGDVDIYGISPEGAIPYEALAVKRERKTVVMLHGEKRDGGRNAEGAVLLSRLAGRGIDYLALGHYHRFQTGALDERGVYAYSGTPSPRGFDEAFPGGVLLIDTEQSPVEPRFLPLGSRPIEILEVTVGEEDDVRACEDAILRAAADIPPEAMLRVLLVGELPPEARRPDTVLLTRALSGRFFFLEIKDKTRLSIDPRDYEGALSLKGAFLRRVLASDLCEEDRQAVIAAGLAALRGEEVAE